MSQKNESNKEKERNANLENAIKVIKDHKKSFREAENIFFIPKSTLYYHIKNPQSGTKRGRKEILNDMEKAMIIDLIKTVVERGFVITIEDIKQLVRTLHPTSSASNKWFYRFKKENNLTLRSTQELSFHRAQNLSYEVVEKWFILLEKILQQFKFTPDCIWNVDETMTEVNTPFGKTLWKRDWHMPINEISGKNRQHITLVAAASASGIALSPYIIFKGIHEKRLKINRKGGVPGAKYTVTESGWMTNEEWANWYSFFVKQLEDLAIRKDNSKHILVVLDGATSHLSNLDLLRQTLKDNIHFLVLPPHTTSLLQPMDVCFFHPLKSKMKQTYLEKRRMYGIQGVSKKEFPSYLGEAWKKAISDKIILKAFQTTGIYPFNPQVVYNKLIHPTNQFSQSSDIKSEKIYQIEEKWIEKLAPKSLSQPIHKSTKFPEGILIDDTFLIERKKKLKEKKKRKNEIERRNQIRKENKDKPKKEKICPWCGLKGHTSRAHHSCLRHKEPKKKNKIHRSDSLSDSEHFKRIKFRKNNHSENQTNNNNNQ